MRTETSEALGRLVSIFVAAIEGAGEVIPDSAIEQLATDPLGTCEKLNELALSCGAIDEGVDAALAAVYESMDAADARGAVDEQCVGSVVTAWASTHVERPVEEPEPEPEPEASETAEPEKGEQAEKPKRRRSRKAKDQRSEVEAGSVSPEPESEQDAPAEQPEPEKNADVKPGRRSRAKAKEQAEKDKGAEKPKRGRKRSEKAIEEQAEVSETPAPEAGEDTAVAPEPAASAPEPDAPAPAATQNTGDTLSVDQATAILGVSRPTIYKLIESGELPAHKKGRSWRISAAAVTERASK